MEWRLSSRLKPSPEEQLACGSQSTSSVLRPSSARQAARLMAVVVLPTPPFWLTTPRIFPMGLQSNGKRNCGLGLALWRIQQICGKWYGLRFGKSSKCLKVKGLKHCSAYGSKYGENRLVVENYLS